LNALRLTALILVVALTAACSGSTEAHVDHASGRPGLIAFSTHAQVWLMAPDGSRRRALTTPKLDAAAPAWSSDGETIAFLATLKGDDSSEYHPADVYLQSLHGGEPRRLDSGRAGQVIGISWAPNGTRIAAAELSREGDGSGDDTAEIVLLDVDSPGRTVIHRSGAEHGLDVLPVWSPDGTTILFTRIGVTGLAELWVMGADGSNSHLLARAAAYGSWSPDGDRVAYTSFRDRNGETCYDECNPNGELYVMDANGSRQTRLTRTRTISETAPTWSPDGTRIAYFRDQSDGSSFIVTVRPDGSCPVRITAAGGEDSFPVWQPGGDRGSGWAGACRADGTEALSPGAGGPTESVAEVRDFNGYPLYAVGDEFEGRPLTAVDRELSPAGAPIPSDSTTFIYAPCDEQRSGAGCSDELQVQVWPACLRNLSLYGGRGPAGLAHRRGVPIKRGPFEVYTGTITIVIFANRETAERVVDALKPVNKLAIDAGAGLGHDLPPPAPGALAGKLRCS
jgi:Tol biopolymer transport system component